MKFPFFFLTKMTAIAQGLFDGQIAQCQSFPGGVFTPHHTMLVEPSYSIL